jgi:DNA-binding XRE family transcriptional regulator
MTFAQKLKLLRDKAGLSQPQLAAAAGIPVATLRDYEQGGRRRHPTLWLAIKLAQALGESVAAFEDCTPDAPPVVPRGRHQAATIGADKAGRLATSNRTRVRRRKET